MKQLNNAMGAISLAVQRLQTRMVRVQRGG